ncbi:MAG: hypothetical protein ACJARS_004443, partial [bacterium]
STGGRRVTPKKNGTGDGARLQHVKYIGQIDALHNGIAQGVPGHKVLDEVFFSVDLKTLVGQGPLREWCEV